MAVVNSNNDYCTTLIQLINCCKIKWAKHTFASTAVAKVGLTLLALVSVIKSVNFVSCCDLYSN